MFYQIQPLIWYMGVMSTVQTTDDYKIVSLPSCIQYMCVRFSSYHLGERKGLATTGFEPASPWQDSNLQSPAIGWDVTITSHGALPVSYAAVNSLQSFGFTRGEVCFLSWEAGYNIWSASESHSDGVIHILINLKITFLHAPKLLDFGTVLVFALRGVQ